MVFLGRGERRRGDQSDGQNVLLLNVTVHLLVLFLVELGAVRPCLVYF